MYRFTNILGIIYDFKTEFAAASGGRATACT